MIMGFDTTLQTVAQALVDLCRAGKDGEAQNTLYAQDAVSVEGLAMPGQDSAEIHGLDAIRGKSEWWYSAHEVHETKVEGPFLNNPDRFSVIFDMDITEKESGTRTQMREIGLYTVKDGQIVREEFFYPE